MRVALLLAVLGAFALAAGVWMVLPAAGVITFGVEALVGAYVIGYLEARREAA